MRNKIMGILVFLLLGLLVAPAMASTWRSSTGNVFRFYAGGTIEAHVQGQVYHGRWWWTRNPTQFQFPWRGSTATVNITGNGASCYVPGYGASYWTLMSSRGEKDNRKDETSWFVALPAPTGLGAK